MGKKFLRRHRPIVAAFLCMVLLSLSFAIFWTGQDWLTFQDPELRETVAKQMQGFHDFLDLYNTPEGRTKVKNVSDLLAKFNVHVDTDAIYEEAVLVCKALEHGGVSPMNLRIFLEIAHTVDEMIDKHVPMEIIYDLLNLFGFDNAVVWIERFEKLLAKTGPALLIYDIMRWTLVGIFALSILLMLLDVGVGPLPFVLVDIVAAAAVVGIGIYVKNKVNLSLTLAPPGFASLAFSLGAFVLWIILGICNKRKSKKQALQPS